MSNIKPIPSFEASHSIGDDGTVYRSIDGTLKPLQGSISYHGYRKVHLRHGVVAKIEAVHRLVASVFIGECKNGDCVTHINGDRLDNRVENLKYITRQEAHQNRVHSDYKHKSGKLTHKGAKAIKDAVQIGGSICRENCDRLSSLRAYR